MESSGKINFLLGKLALVKHTFFVFVVLHNFSLSKVNVWLWMLRTLQEFKFI